MRGGGLVIISAALSGLGGYIFCWWQQSIEVERLRNANAAFQGHIAYLEAGRDVADEAEEFLQEREP